MHDPGVAPVAVRTGSTFVNETDVGIAWEFRFLHDGRVLAFVTRPGEPPFPVLHEEPALCAWLRVIAGAPDQTTAVAAVV